ncbi:MAG: hypothetical protein ACOCPZ_00330 [Natrialbaceae archaeon]
MATLDWHLRRIGGITLVELLVTSETDQRVRIESTLEPVWPPRCRGLPAEGWDDGTFEARIEAGERLVVGYASPAPPVEPPARLRTVPPDGDDPVSPRELIRALGDAKPPRDAVPAGTPAANPDSGPATPNTGRQATDRRSRSTDAAGSGRPVPPMFESWLGAIESRLAAAESPSRGGTDGDKAPRPDVDRSALDRQLAADRDRLDALARRSRRLADRLDGLREPDENTSPAGESE